MDHITQKDYFCNQLEEVVGAEIFFVLIVHFNHSQANLESIEWKRQYKREERKKKMFKLLQPQRRDRFKVKSKVKVESKSVGDGVRGWLDLDILQLIILCGEMEPKFVRNGKKQGIFLKT